MNGDDGSEGEVFRVPHPDIRQAPAEVREGAHIIPPMSREEERVAVGLQAIIEQEEDWQRVHRHPGRIPSEWRRHHDRRRMAMVQLGALPATPENVELRRRLAKLLHLAEPTGPHLTEATYRALVDALEGLYESQPYADPSGYDLACENAEKVLRAARAELGEE